MVSAPPHIALSNICGSVSLASWVVLLLPQLIEQWRTKSAEGISLALLVIWALGDITNLAGALFGHLLPNVILLGAWYCFGDILIFSSYFYYKHHRARETTASNNYNSINSSISATNDRRNKDSPSRDVPTHHQQPNSSSANNSSNTATVDDPTQPLLSRRNSAVQRKNSHSNPHSQRRDSLSNIVEEMSDEKGSVWTQVVLPLAFVIGAGVFGYLISSDGSDDHNRDRSPESDENLGALICGYVSAILYLGARIPQIVRNHKRRSVHGLSLLFFILSMLGNITYAGSILFYSIEKSWVILNLPWLIGSLGTIFQDIIIVLQFHIYRASSTSCAIEEE